MIKSQAENEIDLSKEQAAGCRITRVSKCLSAALLAVVKHSYY